MRAWEWVSGGGGRKVGNGNGPWEKVRGRYNARDSTWEVEWRIRAPHRETEPRSRLAHVGRPLPLPPMPPLEHVADVVRTLSLIHI